MAKTKTQVPASTKSKQAYELKDSDLNFGKFDNYIYIGVIILALFIFFREGIFGGKVFASGDHIAFDSFKTFFDDAKRDGIFALWTPYIFMGMPNFAGLIGFSPRVYDLFGHGFGTLLNLFGSPESSPIFSIVVYYIILDRRILSLYKLQIQKQTRCIIHFFDGSLCYRFNSKNGYGT